MIETDLLPFEVEDDPELDALVHAGQVTVDNLTSGPTCYGGRTAHTKGSDTHCHVCCLYRALLPYSD